MEYVRLGSTVSKVSRIGFGCWAIGGHGYGKVDDRKSIDAIHCALDQGINLFDTADVYGFGHSEEVLAKALGKNMKDIFVATKFGVKWDNQGNTCKDCSPQYLRKAVNGSLRRLRTDCIPIYQIHWHDGKTPIYDIIETLLKLQKEGKICYIGVSNMTKEMLNEVNQQQSITSIQLPFGLNQTGKAQDLKQITSEYDISTFVYGALGRGLLSGKYDLDANFDECDTRNSDGDFKEKYELNLELIRTLNKIASLYNKTAAQIALRWVLDQPGISSALVGIKTRGQVIENACATGWNLRNEDRKKLTQISEIISEKK
ncbi:MAG TPA: aldo/keto reductase [candidate division Zixibacteria bacterium]|nr:aldo/keto reductase [candidate division Zixibacteria bacterium]